MKIKITNIGNSKGIIIPNTILKMMGIDKAGSELDFDYNDGKIILIPNLSKKKNQKKGA